MTRQLGRKGLFHHKSLSAVQPLQPEDPSVRLLLLNDDGAAAAEEKKLELTSYTAHLTYEHFSTDEALRQILPANVDVPSSFETVRFH